MGLTTKISWCDASISFWWGCSHVHSGCDNCYAEKMSKRWGNDIWGNDKPRKEIKSAFTNLSVLQKKAEKEGVIKRVFVGSMMDIFEKPMPLIDSKGAYIQKGLLRSNTGELRDLFFTRIANNHYPNLMFLLLTKRPSNINKYIPESWKINPPSNVMYGYSPVDPATMMNIETFTQVKGKHFLSIEPQLNHIGLTNFLGQNEIDGHRIDWIIQGGESGHNKRPFNLEWARQMRDDCRQLKIPYFFKQIDGKLPIPSDLDIKQFQL